MKTALLSTILLSTFVLLYAAFNAKFPILLPESVLYITSGFTRSIPFDRSITYSLFLSIFSKGISLWSILFIQSISLSITLFYYFKYFVIKHVSIYYLLLVFYISFFMTASIEVSSISPILFSSTGLLALALILFCPRINSYDYIILSIFIVTASSMVLYTIVFYSLLIVLWLFYSLIHHLFSKHTVFKIALRVTFPIFLGTLLVFLLNSILIGKFTLFRNIYISAIPRIHSLDLDSKYLFNELENGSFVIGTYRDTLNTIVDSNAMYNTELSTQNISVLEKISKQIITSSSFKSSNYSIFLNEFLYQLSNVKINSYIDPIQNINFHNTFCIYFPLALREYYLTRQYLLDTSFLNYTHIISVILVIFSNLWIIIYTKGFNRHLSLFFIVSFLIQTILLAFFVGKTSPIQSYTVWVLLIPPYLYICNKLNHQNN